MFGVTFLWILFCKSIVVFSVPEAALNLHGLADRFQNSVQQQTFQSVLLAIEERLRNLDNIYSMQLSETLQSKLDQYYRKLESLDKKIIRLESIVTLNLDRISENISTKNYKDDVMRTETYRKLENVYDGLSHRINYLDRKFELAFEKIQNKVDSGLQRLERMEEDIVQRNADTESDLSVTLSILEDYKSATVDTDQVIVRIANMINETTPSMEVINSTMYHLIQNLHRSVANRFDLLENITFWNLNISKENNATLNSMKGEMKGDFNAYANKVADMNLDIWTRNGVAEESLKTIETVTNFTRTEIQNGVRALMLQIGKVSGKGIMNNDKTSMESLKKSVYIDLEKIIANQELFLESCHRVQKDESQIESEIGVMLGKLIDMLETKMTIVMKDLKNIEKCVKNHDSRINRNLNQANTNIISLFEKTIKANELSEKELQDIKFLLNSFFTLMQDPLPKTEAMNNSEALLTGITLDISHIIQLINKSNEHIAIKWNQLETTFLKNPLMENTTVNQMKKATNVILGDEFKHHVNVTRDVDRSLLEIRTMITHLNETLHSLNLSGISKEGSYKLNNNCAPSKNSSKAAERSDNSSGLIMFEQETNEKSAEQSTKNCSSNYTNLIDVRASFACNDTAENQIHNIINTKQMIVQAEEDRELEKTIMEIFGSQTHTTTTTTTEKTETKSKVNPSKKKKNCVPNWTKLINIRYGSNNNNCTEVPKKTKDKKKRKKLKVTSRFGEDGSMTDGEEEDDYDDSNNTESITDITTDSTLTGTSIATSFEEVTNKTTN